MNMILENFGLPYITIYLDNIRNDQYKEVVEFFVI